MFHVKQLHADQDSKTPKYTGNNKNKNLTKHIPKPHPGIKSTMLRNLTRKYTSPDNYYYPSKIETKFNLEQLLAIHVCQ